MNTDPYTQHVVNLFLTGQTVMTRPDGTEHTITSD